MLTILEIKQNSFRKGKIVIRQNPICDFWNVLNTIYPNGKEFFLYSKFFSSDMNLITVSRKLFLCQKHIAWVIDFFIGASMTSK